MQFDHQFRAMDTDIDVVIVAEEEPVETFDAIGRLFRLQEERFSRFLPESEVTQLNKGERVESPALVEVLRQALVAFEETGGLFNPMVLGALKEAGYGRTFSEIRGGTLAAGPVPDPRVAIAVDGVTCWLRDGEFDPGGIVKGLTVDLAVGLAGRLGYETVLVNAGGDLRGEGPGDGPGGWNLAVAMPGDEGTFAWQGPLVGALATSTTLRRRWTLDDGDEAHHLIDPRSGLPADSPYVQVSCIAAEARVAEVWSKAVLVGGVDGFREAVAAGLEVLAIAENGATSRAGFGEG
jgi:thiamine biosynthesis lipoprotein